MTQLRERLRLTDLSIGYPAEDGMQLLSSDINIAIGQGEILGILGPSGIGKSTLLSTIAGILAPMAGRVIIDGVDATDTPIHQRGVGLVFQEPLLFRHLSVLGNVGYGLRRHGSSRTMADERSHELLSWVGLDQLADRQVHELSGGQAQRIALVRALAPNPAVLLLDEPFSALDTELRQRLAADVVSLVRRERVATIHVTHDPAEADRMCDRVMTLSS